MTLTRVSLAIFLLLIASSILMSHLDQWSKTPSTSLIKKEPLSPTGLGSLSEMDLWLLYQQSLSINDKKNYLQELKESKIPADLQEKILRAAPSLASERLQILSREPDKNIWLLGDLQSQKSYLLTIVADTIKFFQVPVSAIQKEPSGTVFRIIDVFAENKEGEWKGDIQFGKEYSNYRYEFPIHLQGEIRKKYPILIEEEKRANSGYNNYQISLSQGNNSALIPIKKPPTPYRTEGSVLVISKDPIVFASTHPYDVIAPKELEPYLVRLLEIDLIVIYDRSFPFISDSQWQLLTDYVRYGGKLLLYQEKENVSPLSKELQSQSWQKQDLIPDEVSYLHTNYYQGVIANLTDPKIYDIEFRSKLKVTVHGNIDILDKRLFDDIMCFPTMPPLLGTSVFRSSSLKDKYFATGWLGFLFFFCVFLGCGPIFLFLFRKSRGKKVLIYQLILLFFFSGVALGFSNYLRSQMGDIDTLSFYYLNQPHEGYVVDYHMIGGTNTSVPDLEISTPSPFYVLSPLGKNLPDSTSYYSDDAIAVQTSYTSKWQEPNFTQSLWNPTPMMTTQPISSSGGFYIEKSTNTLVNETPFQFTDVWLVEIENPVKQPLLNQHRLDYNRSMTNSMKFKECFLPNLYSNRARNPKTSKHFNLNGVSWTPDSSYFRLFEKSSYRYPIEWEPRFDRYYYPFVGISNGVYVLATIYLDKESEFAFEMPIRSSKLKQTSRTVVWFQRIADKLPP